MTTAGSIAVNVGKPTKDGERNVSVEFTVKMFEGESIEEYEQRYSYFKTKALRELQ